MDVIVVLGLVAFFAASAGYVRLCDRIAGREAFMSESDGSDD